ncbi:Sialin [Hypsibius exemplaris]|uniref:Sialin n=1 Tax=Hypsibius exemplaris TaxID=2072580 RepID=A0A1W0WCA8_HYPEX|nr:Sialin [Hypsibius exemplaris]
MEYKYHSGRVGQRHALMVLAFLGCMFMYATRVGLSVSMVAMTKSTVKIVNLNSETNSSRIIAEVCPLLQTKPLNVSSNNGTVPARKQSRTFDWDSETQGFLHGAFFYGYLVSQIPGGWVSHKIGAKIPMAASMVIIGILTIISPFAADGGVWAFFVVRLLVGFFQGVVYPSITVLWSEWAPPAERGRLLSVTYSGSQLGTVMGMFLAGFLAEAYGWESIFYCFGVLLILWVVPWIFLAYDSPSKHPRISHAEKKYIITSLNPDFEMEYCDHGSSKPIKPIEEKPPVPCLAILKTVPIWALLVAEFGHNWGFYVLLTNLPTYLNNILHFSLKSNGALSAMPYLVRWFVTILSVCLSDWILTKNFCTPTVLRKIFSIGAFVGTGSALVGVAYAGCDATAAVALFALAVGLSGWVYVGYLVQYTEMSPNYAGILIGLGNTVGTTTGIIAPYVVGVLTSGEGGQSVENWQNVFFIAVGLYGFITVIYGAFGSSVRQKWDK